jgi:TetR/AcrR family transcriptional regulator, tetracycline repressor protein
LNPEEEKQRGLTRERLVEVALKLINEEGLDALSMRSLADRLKVKAASLYWHVRDRRELLELLAESILEKVPPARRGGAWRQAVLAGAESLRRSLSAQEDASRVLLEVPDALGHSAVFADIKAQLETAGLRTEEAAEVAMMVMTSVISARAPAERPAADSSAPASIAIDTGSRGVALRAGTPDMQTLFRVPHDQSTAAPAVLRGETVVVRRLRGIGLGEIELNPRRPWRIHVQAPTWNIRVDAAGLDVREIKVDSGAAKLQCLLPRPRGVVPIHISSGVADVALHRPKGVAVIANIATGAVKLKLDDYATRVTMSDVHWQSEGAASSPDRYELQISSGAVKITVDSYEPTGEPAAVALAVAPPPGKASSALEILLDGVESRLSR